MKTHGNYKHGNWKSILIYWENDYPAVIFHMAENPLSLQGCENQRKLNGGVFQQTHGWQVFLDSLKIWPGIWNGFETRAVFVRAVFVRAVFVRAFFRINGWTSVRLPPQKNWRFNPWKMWSPSSTQQKTVVNGKCPIIYGLLYLSQL